MTTSDRPKLLYVAQRQPRYTHAAFIARWRAHAALGMSQARWRNVALYLHCDRVEGLPPRVPLLECDGVAIVVYRSEAARQAHIADEDARRTMKQDELDTFAQPVAHTSLLVREETVRGAPLDGFRLFVFWDAAPREVDAGEPAEGGLVRNRPAGRIGDFECGGVDEFVSAQAEPLCALAACLGDDPRVSGGARVVLTRTTVLHHAP